MRIGSVVIDCRDFATMMGFWRKALHYVPREPPRGEWVVLRDPGGTGPNVSLRGAPDKRPSPGPIRLDLYVDDREAEVSRLLALGATRHRAPEPDEGFEVLADPEGNLFCVVSVPGG